MGVRARAHIEIPSQLQSPWDGVPSESGVVWGGWDMGPDPQQEHVRPCRSPPCPSPVPPPPSPRGLQGWRGSGAHCGHGRPPCRESRGIHTLGESPRWPDRSRSQSGLCAPASWPLCPFQGGPALGLCLLVLVEPALTVDPTATSSS